MAKAISMRDIINWMAVTLLPFSFCALWGMAQDPLPERLITNSFEIEVPPISQEESYLKTHLQNMGKLRFIIYLILAVFPTISVAQNNKPKIVQDINSLPINSNKATYERLLKEFASTGCDIKDIEYGILNATNNGQYEIIPILESTVLPSQKDVKSLVDYYINTGVSIGALCCNPAKAIEYLTIGIDLAGKNNLNKKLFSSLNGQLNHAWGNMAVNYERLNDPKNAATAYLRAAKEIKKYYPINTNVFNEFLGCSSYMMYKYLTEANKGQDVFGECFPYLMEYSESGNLKGLSAVWNYFIDSHNTDGLNFVLFDIIPKEKDQKTIAEFYCATAERFQHDGLYKDAVFYHMQLITHSHINNYKEYLFIDIDGIKHSRFEYIAYCFDKLGENENSVQSILNALSDVAVEFGNDSQEFMYYASYLDSLSDDQIKGPILQKILTEMEK